MKVRSGWGSAQMVRPIPLMTVVAVLRHRRKNAQLVVLLVHNAKTVLLLVVYAVLGALSRSM
jgi:hypothetical protein